MALSQRDQMAKQMKSAYASAEKAGKLGVGFGGEKPAKKTAKKVFNAGGSYTKMKKKVFGTK